MSPAGFPAASKGEPKWNGVQVAPQARDPSPTGNKATGLPVCQSLLRSTWKGEILCFSETRLGTQSNAEQQKGRNRGKDGERVVETRGKETNLDEEKRKGRKRSPGPEPKGCSAG